MRGSKTWHGKQEKGKHVLVTKNCQYFHLRLYLFTYTNIHIPFSFYNCRNTSWHRFNEVLKTLLKDFSYYGHDSVIMSCKSMIHINHISKVLVWPEIWWLCRPFEYSELTIMFMIWPLWHGSLSCFKQLLETVYTAVIKWWTWSSTSINFFSIVDTCAAYVGCSRVMKKTDTQILKPIQAVIGRGAVYTLDKSLVCHSANT